MGEDARRAKRAWWGPLVLFLGVSLTLFWSLYLLDFFFVDRVSSEGESGPWGRYFQFQADYITDAISALAGIVVAVLGIVITVVSIVLQLSAARFSGITRMFLRDRLNGAVVSYYVIVCVCGVWLSVSLQENYVPRAALFAMIGLTTLAVVLMVPYFSYVFWFLEPRNIILRIRQGAWKSTQAGARASSVEEVARCQEQTLFALEELTDIASASIAERDKLIASCAVDALKDLTLSYLQLKQGAASQWFSVHESIAINPDFVAMDPESLRDLEQRRTWVEWKVMRQYLGIYNEALLHMRDINYLLAIDTRYIGEASTELQDDELARLVYRYMNSYLRATLNARDVRTAYNVLNQYRLLVESFLAAGRGELALQGVKHMIYYGHVSFDMKLTFVTETVAYDVSSLCQAAHAAQLPEESAMLANFLELDRPLRVQSQESALLGIRKAQVKLAAYYLSLGQTERARAIALDMREEPSSRLRQIQSSLERVTSKDFWEIIDRGRNFEYMPDEQRQTLPLFFSWLE